MQFTTKSFCNMFNVGNINIISDETILVQAYFHAKKCMY